MNRRPPTIVPPTTAAVLEAIDAFCAELSGHVQTPRYVSAQTVRRILLAWETSGLRPEGTRTDGAR